MPRRSGYISRVDLDAYVAAHREQWARLDRLARQRRRTGAEADELLDLYQRVSTHLSVVRSSSPDPSVVAHLSLVLAKARVAMAGARTGSWRDLARFFTATFPAALYRLRWWWLSTTVAAVLLAVAVGLYAMNHPRVWVSRMTPEEIAAYVDTDFARYYSEFPHHEFASLVWVNNTWVAALCIALGVLGLPVVYLLGQNVVSIGVTGGLMAAHDRFGLFLGLILPHGLLELTAIFVAGAAGLRLFWSWIRPGAQSRLDAFAAEGRRAVAVALGLGVVLLVSGVIEGFVTPSDLPTAARIAIGLLAEALFLGYVFVVGRRAAAGGITGDVSAADRPAALPTSA